MKPQPKTGRHIASNGYIKIRMPGHHLADKGGYVYEHRLVAEQKLGRALLPGEIVHHIDGDKQNNSPENISAEQSIAHHYLHHRKNPNLRLPNEPNLIITCACGCGTSFSKYDTTGRPRKYISGHNPQPASTRNAIITILLNGPCHRRDIANKTGINYQAIAVALSKLRKKNIVKIVGRGIWSLSEGVDVNENKDRVG